MTIRPSLLDFVAGFEGFKAIAYQDPAGVWTIGYGTTRIYDLPVTMGMMLNEAVARALLYADVKSAMAAVERQVTRPLTLHQLEALTDFVYNLGSGSLAGSTLLQELNAGRPVIREYFTRWNKARVNSVLTPLPGLTRRRNKEYEWFSRPMVD